MFPIRDENPTLRTPVATIGLIVVNLFIWMFVQGAGSDVPLARSLCLYSLIPGELLHAVPVGTRLDLAENMACVLDGKDGVATLITHAFMHGSWFHIITNLWFLWIFGDNVEDAMGPFRFLCFYGLCILAAAAAQIMADPDAITPMVGASGAIGGVMGAYARLYPRAYVLTLIPLGFFITTAAIPAIYMLGFWFFIQLISAIPAVGGPAQIAFWAHAGGFVAGLLLIRPISRQDYIDEHNRLTPDRSAKYRL
ncbi:rhomboid family intramembrane serine protease [Methylomicrobium sp. Wu6]|uniref:rhomboid family intramembrane serine protease n=1 Tax=Methylomicrobium sp. Wu6 TaxID=3107928 RepID=UPI002DD65519|nr:rhomboid family intramembrane serine protease [Methylomicrobium sp. Wu6]MEC4748164.1 rhomboid family intramembrane serine protease [Methylomicrobium sp. Wu6]